MSNVITQAALAPFLAQSAPAPGGSSLTFPIVMMLMLAAMYFLMIAPQRKKQKEHQKMLGALASGDEVLTAGGIYGIVTNVKDNRLVVRIADGTKVEIARSFVQSVEKKASAS